MVSAGVARVSRVDSRVDSGGSNTVDSRGGDVAVAKVGGVSDVVGVAGGVGVGNGETGVDLANGVGLGLSLTLAVVAVDGRESVVESVVNSVVDSSVDSRVDS